MGNDDDSPFFTLPTSVLGLLWIGVFFQNSMLYWLCENRHVLPFASFMRLLQTLN